MNLQDALSTLWKISGQAQVEDPIPVVVVEPTVAGEEERAHIEYIQAPDNIIELIDSLLRPRLN